MKQSELRKIIREEIEKSIVETPSTAATGCVNTSNGVCAWKWFQWRRNKMSTFMSNKTCNGPYTFDGVIHQFGLKYGEIKLKYQDKIAIQGNTAAAAPLWNSLEQSGGGGVSGWSDIKSVVHQLAALGSINNNNRKDRLMRVVAKYEWAFCMKSSVRCNC
mgnify:CR=1 FL=1|tara:strand:- start:757 stop:1236 length:480 start_codon:yes stop_codon:yes gene_type:complete